MKKALLTALAMATVSAPMVAAPAADASAEGVPPLPPEAPADETNV